MHAGLRLNYHHLLYFWTVARAETVTRASLELGVSQPSVSSQIHALEGALGHKLFERRGRNLALTDKGRVVFRYADQIFSLGMDLTEAIDGWEAGQPIRLVVGVSQVIPKRVCAQLIEAATAVKPGVRLVCREGRMMELLPALALHEVDVILADEPADPQVRVRAFNHLLRESATSFFGAPRFAALRDGFPRSLEGAPLLLQGETTSVRRQLEAWFASERVRPRVVAEFDDSGLMKAFGRRGLGVFAAPTIIADEIQRDFGVEEVGRTDEVRERFYAITSERRLEHPAVAAMVAAARGRRAEGRDPS